MAIDIHCFDDTTAFCLWRQPRHKDCHSVLLYPFDSFLEDQFSFRISFFGVEILIAKLWSEGKKIIDEDGLDAHIIDKVNIVRQFGDVIFMSNENYSDCRLPRQLLNSL